MALVKDGLFSFKRQHALRHHEASIFGPKFNVWVLERWKFTHGSCDFPTPLGYGDNIDASMLEDFLLRKGIFDSHRQPEGDKFEGRLRLLFSTKKNATEPPLSMSPKEFELIEAQLGLHPSTVQYALRTMKASKFWSADGKSANHLVLVDLVLSFPPTPLVQFDSISLSYDVHSRFTNALVGENNSAEHGEDETIQRNTLKAMLDHCHAYWAHPLLVPVLFIDLFMTSLEAQIAENISSIKRYEYDVPKLASLDKNAKPLSERQNITQLLTDLHETLKDAIKLLDAANWMQRAAKLLIEVGDDENFQTPAPWMKTEWAQIRSFLEDIVQIAENLIPDPVMTQQRCQSQIDILNSQIAQEDNLLAARVAVSATRDSSAMKALAVITALFLPGTYIATLFSMSMFDWQGGSNSSASSNSTEASGSAASQSAVVMPYIWIYAVVSVVLTVAVVFGWRVWWVKQDRDFRIKLPKTVRSVALDKNPSSADSGLATSFWEEVFWGDMKRAWSKESSV